MSRLQKQPILYQNELKVPEKYLRFATPEVVAVYRADRLKCKKLVEIGAGIGGQTIAFSKICKEVLAIESNKDSSKVLIQNLKKLNIKNVEVLVADALLKTTVEKIKKFQPDIIFCDTERPEKAERTLENIKPPIKKILEIFSEITSKIAIEIPPFTNTEKLEIKKTSTSCRDAGVVKNPQEVPNYEKEFISVNQQLNRLTLYFNELKQDDVSAVALPSGEKIRGTNFASTNYSHLGREGGINERNYKFLYLIDPTIILANLVNEISNKFNSQILELNKPILLSDKIIKSDFLTGYKILATCKNEQKEILQNLKKINAKKVELRYNINPKDYWKIRNFYENQLEGNKEISLFIDEKNNEAILCEKMN